MGYRTTSSSVNIMSDSNDIQNIHRRYTLTLINPASFYVSLCGSIAVASIISFLCFNNYIENYEILYHLPAVVAVLLAIQYLDSRFTKHKEYSKITAYVIFWNYTVVDHYSRRNYRICYTIKGTNIVLCCCWHVHIF